jgi:hypothetical protein
MAKAYIQLYYDFIEATEALSDEECGRLVRAMVEYGRSGVVPEAALVGSVRCIFPTFRLQLDRDSRAYEARVLQNAINGRKGGRPRKDENDEINPTVILETEKSQDKEEEKEKDEDKEKEKEKECVSPGACAPHSPALDDVLDFCRDNGLKTDPHTFWNHYQAVGWRAGGRPIRDWQAKLREWEARDAAAPPRSTPSRSAPAAPANPALNYAQREYPDDDHYYIDLDALGTRI